MSSVECRSFESGGFGNRRRPGERALRTDPVRTRNIIRQIGSGRARRSKPMGAVTRDRLARPARRAPEPRRRAGRGAVHGWVCPETEGFGVVVPVHDGALGNQPVSG